MTAAENLETGSKKVPSEAEFRRAAKMLDSVFGDQTDTGFKKGRGGLKRSLDLVEAMCGIAEAPQPSTCRGVGYKLFAAKLIPSMERADMERVYRLLKEERERGEIPW